VGLRQGIKLGLPVGVVVATIGVSFGVLATGAGWSGVQAIVASVLIYSGSGQFALLAVLASGGTALAAIGAATLVQARYLPMGVAVAASLRGGPARRAAESQVLVDASWAFAHKGDGTFDREVLIGSSLPQYVGWVLGTCAGVLVGDVLPDSESIGLDVIFPAFFLALLLGELRRARGPLAAGLAAVITIALIPVAPAGVPVVAAGLAALIGVRRR
jgi:4-azaleucine resistance transporter AzlC